MPPINKNLNYWYVGIGLKFDIASTFKSGKKIRLARLSTRRVQENDLLLQENVRTEVKAVYIRFYEAFTICDTQEKSLELAAQNYSVVNNRYLNDLALITDMLDASNSKLNAELQLVNAQVKQLIVPVNSRVQGFIKKIYFDEYQEVRKGDTLALIEDSEFRFRLAQAEADFQNAISGKNAVATTVHTTQNNIAVSDAGLQEAKVRLDNAEREYHRYKNLLAQAALELARLNLSYTVILAPCDGTTGRKDIQEGQLIQPGQTLVDVVYENERWVVANYKETQTTYIREGQPVEIEVDAVPGIIFKGIVKSISRATGASFSLLPQDNSAGNFVKVEQRIPIRIEFSTGNRPEDMERLRAGMNVECVVNY